jgi:proteasome lid subunit RPN8/RPN11
MFQEEIVLHAESKPDEEVCGFVLLNKDLTVSVERSTNENPNPGECFTISSAKFLKYNIEKKILGIYHSHPKSDEKPSKADMDMSEEMGVPYLIYSLITKKFYLYYPESYNTNMLTGRPYIKGFFECTCIFKDYFKKELNINISKWNKNYWLPEEDNKANKLLLKILNKNLIKIEDKKLNKHDVVVFEIKKGKRFHVGIYLGNDYFMHQPDGVLSRRELMDERWQGKIKEVYRHTSLV